MNCGDPGSNHWSGIVSCDEVTKMAVKLKYGDSRGIGEALRYKVQSVTTEFGIAWDLSPGLLSLILLKYHSIHYVVYDYSVN